MSQQTETAGKIWFEAIDLINQEGQVVDIQELVVQFDLYESIYNLSLIHI